MRKKPTFYLPLILSFGLIISSSISLPVFANTDTTQVTADTTTGTTTDTTTDTATDTTTGTTDTTEESAEPSKGKKGPSTRAKGLAKAFENVKGTPAEEVIGKLLNDGYNVEEVTDLLAQEAESIEEQGETEVEKKAKQDELKALAKELRKNLKEQAKYLKGQEKALTKIAELYEKVGSVNEAIETQREAILANIQDLESYKKLGKMYEKAGKKGINAFVNGVEPKFDVPPVVKEGRTLLPLRAISESLKAEVQWDATTKTVTIARDGVVIKLTLGENIATINGQEVTLDVPLTDMKGRTLVPLRFISEAFGSNITWEPETKSVVILEEDAGVNETTTSQQ